MQIIADYISTRINSFKNDMEVADKNHCAYMHSYARGAYDVLCDMAAFVAKVNLEKEYAEMAKMEDKKHEC